MSDPFTVIVIRPCAHQACGPANVFSNMSVVTDMEAMRQVWGERLCGETGVGGGSRDRYVHEGWMREEEEKENEVK